MNSRGPSLPGVVRALLSSTLLAQALEAGRAWDEVLRTAPGGAHRGKYLHNLPPGVLIAFIPDVRLAHEVIATETPLKEGQIPAFSIRHIAGEWRLLPQSIVASRFQEHVLIELERTDWLNAACQLMRAPYDKTAWEIVSAWPSWQAQRLSWPKRAKNLAARSGMSSMKRNSLQKKCNRWDLIR